MTKNKNKEMNERVRLIRQDLRLEQIDFAKTLGYAQGSISQIEISKAPVSMKFINKMYITFGVNKEYVLTGKGPMYNKNFDKRDTKIMLSHQAANNGDEDKLDTIQKELQGLKADVGQLSKTVMMIQGKLLEFSDMGNRSSGNRSKTA